MAMIRCMECGHGVSTTAERCPNCGARVVKKKANSGCLGYYMFNNHGACLLYDFKSICSFRVFNRTYMDDCISDNI